MRAADSGLSIGELARSAGVRVETLRFYERKGLLAEPPRRSSGYRAYPRDALRRVLFIRRAKDLGFTLREIAELLSLRVDPHKSCADVRAIAKARIADVDARIAELTRIKVALERLERGCRGKGPTGACPILDAIEKAGSEDDGMSAGRGNARQAEPSRADH